jgi:hypothetical protein
MNESQLAVLRATSGFRGWRVLNPVGVWPRSDVRVEVVPHVFDLKVTPPIGEALVLHPSPLTEDSVRLARLLEGR